MITQFVAILSAHALGSTGENIDLDVLQDEYGVTGDEVSEASAFSKTRAVKQAVWVNSKNIVDNVKVSGVPLIDLYAGLNHTQNQNTDETDLLLKLSQTDGDCHSRCHYNCHGSRGWR